MTLLLSSDRLGESAVAIEPVEVLPIPADVSYPSSNETIPDRQDEPVRESKEDHARSASPFISILREQEVLTQTDAPVSEPFVAGTPTPTPSADTARTGEAATRPDIANERLDEFSPPPDTAAAMLPTTTISSDCATEAVTCEGTEPPPAVVGPLPKARGFSEPKPSPTTRSHQERAKVRSKPRTDANLPIRLQLVFGHGGSIKTFALFRPS